MIEEFSTFIAKNTGLNLSTNEILKLYVHYYNEETNRVNYDKLIADVKSNIKDQKLDAVGKFDLLDAYKVKEKKKTLSYDELIQVIYNRIESKIINLTGKDHLKKVYLLLSESRSPVVTRHQLKTACHSRLALFLKDADIDLIFNKLDVDRQGAVNIRLLINDIMKKEHKHDVTLIVGMNARPPIVKKTFDQNENEKAHLTYDNKYVNLIEPNPDRCVSHSPLDIERIIRSKITERCTGSDNMAKTAYKLFMDGSHQKGDPRITLHHVQYTLWKKLRLNITAADVLRFYNNYDREGKGFIYMSVFLDGIIKQLDIGEPLLEDKSHLSKSDRIIVVKKINESADLKLFFSAMRR
jgi:Ca2+-binding EF-hand superfamily protein